MTKKCPNCGGQNAESNRFCESCGAKLILQQPEIKTAVPKEREKNLAVAGSELAYTEKQKTIAEKTPPASPTNTTALKNSFAGLNIEHVLYFLLIVIGLFSRFYDLGYKPLHHDESIHALNSYNLYRGEGFRYDPGYHGPLLYFVNALVYFFFGTTDYTARIAPAFMGLLLILLPYFMREWIGKTAALILSLLFTISPTFLYVSRFIRHDIYLSLGTLVMILCYFRYRQDPRPRFAYIFAFALAVCFISMESTYLHVSILFPFLVFMFFWDAYHQSTLNKVVSQHKESFQKNTKTETIYIAYGLTLLSIVIVYAFLIYPSWHSAGKGSGMMEDLNTYVSVAEQKNKNDGMTYTLVKFLTQNPSLTCTAVGLSVPALLVATFFGLGWYTKSFKTAFYCYLIFYAVFVPLFTSFFFNPHGLFTGFIRSLTYWLAQQSVSRGDQPWFYYYGLLSLYELCMVVFTLIGFYIFTFVQRSVFSSFTLYWVIGSFIAYVTASEKMPWITIHMLLPMTVLTALTVAYFLEQRIQIFKYAIVSLFGLLCMLLVHNAISLAYYNPANPVEPMVYVQSTNSVKDMMRIIDRLAVRQAAEKAVQVGDKTMEIACEDLCSWPFAWYLRDYKNMDFPNPISNASVRPVVLSAWQTGQAGGDEHDKAAEKLLGATYHHQRYKLRAWWNWTDAPHFELGDYWHWLLYRKPWKVGKDQNDPFGSQDMIFWVRNDLWEQSQ